MTSWSYVIDFSG